MLNGELCFTWKICVVEKLINPKLYVDCASIVSVQLLG